jgi:hypothetical protein
MLQNLFNLIVETLTNFADGSALVGSLGGHYGAMYSWASSVNRSVSMPIAYEVLTLFCIIELAQAAFRTAENSTNGMVGISNLVKLAIKYGLCKAVIDNSQTILKALYGLSSSATSSLSGMGSAISYDWNTSALQAAVEEQTANATFLETIPSAIVLIITLLIVWGSCQLVRVVIAVRFVHLYCLYAFAPIPMATMLADGQWNMAPGFIRSWLAACFHGTMLYFIMGSFRYMAADMVVNSNSLLGACTSTTGIVIVLIICMMSAERLSGKLFGA